MSSWHKKQIGNLTLYQASTISWLPSVVQGFTTRGGGVSKAPYESLNLGLHTGDTADQVNRNRTILADSLGISADSMIYAEQIHGASVGVVSDNSNQLILGVDVLITDKRDIFLTMLYADCYPVYIIDPHRKIAALAHAGWRGIDAGVIKETVHALKTQYDLKPASCQVAVGPGICAENFEVDSEVADKFRETYAAGASSPVMPRHEMTSKWNVNLRAILFSQLLACGFSPHSISVCDMDTYSNPTEFFSHRRESQLGLQTGRMAAVLGFRPDKGYSP